MSTRTRADLLSVLDSVLADGNFPRLRRFVFEYFEGENHVKLEDDLERVLAVLAPYLEYEEAYGDADRLKRLQRLRDVLDSADDALVERTVWALEIDQIKDLRGRLEQGVITRSVYEAQLQKLSPVEIDVRRIALWAEHNGTKKGK